MSSFCLMISSLTCLVNENLEADEYNLEYFKQLSPGIDKMKS